MKNKYKDNIKNNEEIKSCKFKQIQDILESNLYDETTKKTLINDIYIEIEDIDKDIKKDIDKLNIEENKECNEKHRNSESKCKHSNQEKIYNNKVNKNIILEKKKDINDSRNFLDIKNIDKEINEYINIIKDELDIIVRNNNKNNSETYLYNVIKLKMDLNKISSDILLFKYNYLDYLNTE